MNTKIEGIIFDLDNTLVLSEKIHFEAVKNIAAEINVQIDWKFYMSEYAGKDIRSIFRSIIAYAKAEVTEEKIDVLVEEKRAELIEVVKDMKVETVPGIEAFLQQIKAANIPMIIATNSFKDEVEAILYAANLIQYFSRIVTVWEVEKPKPAPDIYLESARALNSSVKRCIVFEDSPSGLDAANSAQAFTVGLATTLPEVEAILHEPEMLIHNYTEITLESLNAKFDEWVRTQG